MMSGECSYTFVSVVKAVGQVVVWKSCGNSKCFVKSPSNGIDIWVLVEAYQILRRSPLRVESCGTECESLWNGVSNFIDILMGSGQTKL